jgi:hypothetical protein
MNKERLKEFMKDPLVREAYEEDGILEVARLASMIGNLDRDQELREIAAVLMEKGMGALRG